MASSSVKVGSKVTVNGKPQLGVATVKYVGETEFQSGIWVGLQLESAAGKNDGSVKGKRYFTVQPNYGLFVKLDQITPIKTTTKTSTAAKATTSSTSLKDSRLRSGSSSKTAVSTSSASPSASARPRSPSSSSSTKPKTTTTPAKTSRPSTASSSPRVTKEEEPPTEEQEDTTTTETTQEPEEKNTEEEKKPSTSVPPLSTSSAASASSHSPEVTPPMSPSSSASGMLSPSSSASGVLSPSSSASGILSPSSSGNSAAPSPSPSTLRNDSIEKLMRALKELNEFKIKAQETIRGLRQVVKDNAAQTEKLVKEHQKEKETLEKEIQKYKQEAEKSTNKLTKGWEEEKQQLEEQISNLTESIEELTIDKEIAEEKAEALEQELAQVNEKLQIAILNQQSAAAARASQSSEEQEEDPKALKEKNERLTEALMKLRDLSVSEKQESQKRIKELEREVKNLQPYQEKAQKLDQENKELKNEIDELKDALDAATESEEMIEKLTNTNLALEDQVRELQSTIEELEEMKTLSEELEENLVAVEKQLRSELYAKEIEILDQAGVISNLKRKIEDGERTIEQFRIVVRNQQDQLSLLKQKESDTLSHATELNTQSQQLLNMNLQLQSKILKSTSIAIDQEIGKLNLSQAEIRFAFIKDFLPGNTLQADLESVSFLLLMKRFSTKSDIITKHIQHFQLAQQKSEDKYSPDELAFYLELQHMLSVIKSVSEYFEYTMNRCDTELYLKLGTLHFDLFPLEKQLDAILGLLREEELTKSYPLADLAMLRDRLNQLSVTYLDINKLQISKVLEREVKDVMFLLSSIIVEERKMSAELDKKINSTVPSHPPLAGVPSKIAQRNIEMCKKLLKTLENYQPKPTDVLTVKEKVGFNKQITDKALQVFKALNAAVTEALKDVQTSAAESVYQITESTIASKVDKEWKWLDEILTASYNNFSEISDTMLTGLPIPQETEDKKESPYYQRAEIVKTELSDAAGLKLKLEEKQHELIELKKLNQMKENELRDAKWKEEALEKKLQRASKNEEKLNTQLAQEAGKHLEKEKMFQEALDTLEKTNDEHVQENKQLKEKIAKAEAKVIQLEKQLQAQPTIPTELIAAQTSSLNAIIRYLRIENAQLRGLEAKRQLASLLTPLNRAAAPTVAVEQPKVVNDMTSCNKEIQNLMQEIQSKRVSMKVVDLESSASVPVSQQLHNQKAQLESLQKRMQELKQKVHTVVTNVDTAKTKTPLSSFPTTALVKSLREQKPTLVGKVQLPATASATKTGRIKVVVNPKQFETIHTIFVN